MLYAQYQQKQLVYNCEYCGKVEDATENKRVVVSNVQLKKTGQEFSHVINKYTKYDPTLPRIDNILCPNADCKTNRGGSGNGGEGEKVPREIIYIRYDNVRMKYVYMCTTCDTVWKQNDNN